MVEEGSSRHCISLLATVEFHEYFGGCACHAKRSFASVNVMASCQEIGIEGGVMKESLENNSLITGLSHVPDTASTTTGARILVGVILDIDLRSRVFGPSAFAIYQS